ncbi:MAG TPA: hypothetical protein VFE05_18180 [Longimicrobiaceae bacterium]|nr:hypothetical protein [Longimicrobiaceae bacterium]
MKPSARRVTLSVALVVLGWLGTEAVYDLLLVPRLGRWMHVPVEWWLLVVLPYAICIPLAGRVLRSHVETLWAAGALALLSTAGGAAVALLHLPGTAKSSFFEWPVVYWTTTPPVYFILSGALLSLARLIVRPGPPTCARATTVGAADRPTPIISRERGPAFRHASPDTSERA